MELAQSRMGHAAIDRRQHDRMGYSAGVSAAPSTDPLGWFREPISGSS
jgi:hypothetical protein